MNQYVDWILQGLILTTGIYFVLRFLRTTRGGGLLRGLVITLLFGAVGLWGLAKQLNFEELDHIIQIVTPSVVVVLAILFQPELRRGIAQLGKHPWLGRLFEARRQETINEVVQAMNALAGRRIGALVAFEREFALDAYIENAVKIDSGVNRLLLESIFHPGGALHDGAVVIRKDRVAAATSLFPLTENSEISKSVGTRHRAALGLTEETDAVTIAVSEETGGISICRRGKMTRDVPPGKVEETLRAALEDGAPEARETTERETGAALVGRFLTDLFTADVRRKVAAMALAAGMLVVAHQDITDAETVPLTIVKETPDRRARPRPGVLAIRVPGDDYHLVTPRVNDRVRVRISGTRAVLDRARGSLGGVIDVSDDLAGTEIDLPLDQVTWSYGDGSGTDRLSVSWGPEVARLAMERYGQRRVELSPAHLEIDATRLDPRFEADPTGLTFEPTAIWVTGPQGAMSALGTDELPFALEPLVLGPDDTADRSEIVRPARALRDRGISVEGDIAIRATLPILPVEQSAGTFEKDVAIVCLAPGAESESEAWSHGALTGKARFTIMTRGVLPATATDSSQPVHFGVRKLVQDNLRVFVDTAEIGELEGSTVRVQWTGLEDWRAQLEPDTGPLDDRAGLWVELESDPQILLVRRETAESGATGGGASAPGERDG